ncbi:translation elongation factor Ts [Thecamonas trahens ATCC 50062]|uniref:Elongation factor Ts, mitochondrial n=1 Tax=Thecamonas trahens ATCC 50062 TaxID=461836 RepID=A0A0L0DVZ6_THETB|nr:translation elongation factor Ts [Thecamonas trahens ATCC 50062]KNC56499.1 translation elongation factor Ts [Thecamonas trahens ATCC 50062]|eukprot:XP_013752622.1 translation elongation factor Ts [Thecamonas trahens ATCC 50062]
MDEACVVSQVDLFELKDRLKRVAVKEGGISLAQWIKTFKEVGITDDGFLRGFYSLFDSQKNEWIDFKEFAIYSALVGRPRREKKVEYCFRVFDRNGSGALDKEEMRKLIKAAVRVIKRCNNTLPGLTPSKKPSKIERFELSASEKKAIVKAADKIFKRLDKDDDGEVSYRIFQTDGDVKEVRTVLDYFMALTDALPAERASSSKKRKSKKGSDSSSDDSSSKKGKRKGSKKGKGKDKKGSKKGKDKKGSKKGKDKKGSKKGKDKKGSKKGKEKGSKKGSKKDKKASKKDKKASKKDKKASKKGSKKGSKKDKGKGKALTAAPRAASMALIKELRAATNAPLKDCKQALEETAGDVGAAQKWLIEKGKVVAAKKSAGRTANEGLIGLATAADAAVLVEINCETDFAAKNEAFHAFVASLTSRALTAPRSGPGPLDLSVLEGETLDNDIAELTLKIGEPLKLARGVALESEVVGGYVHAGSTGGKVGDVELGRAGALVALRGSAAAAPVARQLAQHIVGMQPASHADLLAQPFLFDGDKSVAEVIGRDAEIEYVQLAVGESASE